MFHENLILLATMMSLAVKQKNPIDHQLGVTAESIVKVRSSGHVHCLLGKSTLPTLDRTMDFRHRTRPVAQMEHTG